jgi:hypothetical protein
MRRMWIVEYAALSLAFSASLVSAPGEGAIGKVTDIPDTAARGVSQAGGICASAAGSRIILDSGSNIWLAPGARGTFYRDHLELESGGASMRLSSGFEVRVNDFTFRADEAASAAILMLDSGHTALAVRAGTIRVASNGVVIAPAVRVGQSLEFAMAQSPSSGGTTGAGGNGNRNGNPATGNCSCTICVEGTISIASGKTYIKDDLTGATIEIVLGRGVEAPKNGDRKIACINVTQKANDKNEGMVGNVPLLGPGKPAGNPVNVIKWCGIVTKDADGNYWSVNVATGLRFRVNPGISRGELTKWLEAGKKKTPFCIEGMGLPPDKDRPMPVLNPNVCFEGKIKIEGKGKDQIVTMVDDRTGAEIRITNPQEYPAQRGAGGFKAKVCGYISTPANPIANSGTAITLMPGTKVEETGNLKTSDPIRSVTGTVTKDKDGKYWVTDPVTGLKFEITADDAEKKELDKVIDKDATITGTVKPPAAGDSQPTISKPKVVALGGGEVPDAGGVTGAGGAGGHGAVVSEVTGSAAVLLVGLIAVAETNSSSSPTSP